jgi:hypothetical protein
MDTVGAARGWIRKHIGRHHHDVGEHVGCERALLFLAGPLV